VTDSVLDVLKLVLLALLYLFFGRVLWAVWNQLRPGRDRPVATAPPTPAPKASKGTRKRPGRLVILEPRTRKGMAYPIGNEVTIGRDATCTITLTEDTFASSLHARVATHDGRPMLEDLGSTNGTLHNGIRVTGPRAL